MTIMQKILLCTGLVAILFMMVVPPNITTESSGDSSYFSAIKVIRYQPFFTKAVKDIHYQRLVLQCLIAVTVTAGLLKVCGRTQKSAKKRARQLAEISEKLRQEAAQRLRSEEDLQQENAELMEINEKLKKEIAENTLAESLRRQNADLMKINEKLKKQIAENTLAESLRQQDAELMEINEKLKEEIAQYNLAEKSLQKRNAELTATNEKFREEIAELNEVEKELKKYRDQLEKYFQQQDSLSTAAKEQTQPQTSETVKADNKNSDKFEGPLGDKFDNMRNRMVNDMQNLNDFIGNSDL